VVVSSDRPVSIFQQGKEIVTRYSDGSSSRCNLYPIPLRQWIEEGHE